MKIKKKKKREHKLLISEIKEEVSPRSHGN